MFSAHTSAQRRPKAYAHKTFSYPLVFFIARCQYVVMVCIYCKSGTQVTNSRLQRRLNHVWRRRKCLSCGTIFTTTELVETSSLLTVQNGNNSEPFSRDKLFISVYTSLKHRKTALTDATALTKTIIVHVCAQHNQTIIQRDNIVREVIKVLGRFDPAAKVYYTSFHPL